MHVNYFSLMLLFVVEIYSLETSLDSLRFKRGECGCQNGKFKCTSGQCLDQSSVCDGNKDCDDGSDETVTQCANIRCPDFSFQCAYGACIEKNKRCNNVDDCSDGSDEELCARMDKPKAKLTPKQPPPPVQPPPVSRDSCLLPNYPNDGSYIVQYCHENSTACSSGPNSTAPMNTILTFQCNNGFNLSQPVKHIICLNGVWEPEPPQCFKQCKPLISNSMKLECFYGGKPVNCDSPITPGTTVRPQCKNYYHISDPSLAFFESVCQADGTWEKPLFRCVPDCGKPYVAYQLLRSGDHGIGDQRPKDGKYPWHAALYLKTNGEWQAVCGGTIISPYIILTAAHCVYIEDKAQVRKPKDLKVAVGKYRRPWDAHDAFEQRLNVKQIIAARTYRGIINNYENDIAVLDLEAPIVLSATVLPACVDWLSEQVFNVGMKGTMVDWWFNENKAPIEFSQVSEALELPYYDYDLCRNRSPTIFLKFITYDKFCAEYKNGTRGIGGSGVTFVRNDRHYVHGIASVKVRDGNLVAFTNVSEHIQWLNNVTRALIQLHSN